MGQIMKSLDVTLFVCPSVFMDFYRCNFDSILMKFCAVIQGLKSKIEIVWGGNWTTPSFVFPNFLPLIGAFKN